MTTYYTLEFQSDECYVNSDPYPEREKLNFKCGIFNSVEEYKKGISSLKQEIDLYPHLSGTILVYSYCKMNKCIIKDEFSSYYGTSCYLFKNRAAHLEIMEPYGSSK